MGLKEGKKVMGELVGSVKQVRTMNDLGMFSAPPVAWFKQCVWWGSHYNWGAEVLEKALKSLMEPPHRPVVEIDFARPWTSQPILHNVMAYTFSPPHFRSRPYLVE